MPMICYVEKRFNEVALEMIDKVNDLVDRYQAQGFDLTLRQIYYQFVAADLFPADRKFRMTDAGKWVRDPEGTINAEPNYKWLGDIISEGRRAGLIDWEAIVDRTRHIRNPIAWDSPAALVAACADQYDVDRWKNQPFHVEVKAVNPPPNPAKITDSRAGGYIKKFGKKSWELDALDPTYLSNLIAKEMRKLVDSSEWLAAEQRRDEGRDKLFDVVGRLEDEEAGL